MKRENTRAKLFSRRAAVLLGGKVLLMGGLASRMYYLQVIEGSRYATLADENRINISNNGQFNPHFDNRTHNGRMANRRVDIILEPILL